MGYHTDFDTTSSLEDETKVCVLEFQLKKNLNLIDVIIQGDPQAGMGNDQDILWSIIFLTYRIKTYVIFLTCSIIFLTSMLFGIM